MQIRLAIHTFHVSTIYFPWSFYSVLISPTVFYFCYNSLYSCIAAVCFSLKTYQELYFYQCVFIDYKYTTTFNILRVLSLIVHYFVFIVICMLYLYQIKMFIYVQKAIKNLRPACTKLFK